MSSRAFHRVATVRPVQPDEEAAVGDARQDGGLDGDSDYIFLTTLICLLVAGALGVVLFVLAHASGWLSPGSGPEPELQAADSELCLGEGRYCQAAVQQDLRCLVSFVLGIVLAHVVGAASKESNEDGGLKRWAAVLGTL
mmetsp:Transcript_11729/g.33775  ORF Transcript_11729/g.33775 Transcript_11729/m.33775 type:complete len:140 (-) Transcript_11729:149-568(-)|eukprot:CAMPEP_0176103552 /NCGR_PEP_ID=MMETSP0120_2-20121206/51955_1 /TAXON_ID=160619 /ORGANISM="Kryptoperidinium foliaceum, Strain CCMP 1326" /LENGTH=139 /DNA_ID=CAMNT_0017437643 /DNA_START=77 /DNA_END=496 /DNA_ORIENTATION=+